MMGMATCMIKHRKQNLTMEDLQKIKGRRDGKHGLLPVLSGLYHSRPEYPDKDD